MLGSGVFLCSLKNIRQNLFFALIYNGNGVLISAGILYPFLGILIDSIFAAFAMIALRRLKFWTKNIVNPSELGPEQGPLF